ILEYHRVGPLRPTLPAISRRLTVDPATFGSQMEWLQRHGFHAATMRQAYDALALGRPLPPRPVMVTFDDGYRDVLWNAAPVLHRLRMPATEFVITGRVDGQDPSFLTWPELRRLQRAGFAIGSHTVTHADLPALPPAQALGQLERSRAALLAHLRRPADWLAYPCGRVDAAVVGLARRAGYLLGVTERPGAVQSAADPLELHRFEVLDTTGVAGFSALLGR
ncbi:MAG: polysaccharide deacetylase family protein, partial [Gaiellaceae bacterium]